MKCPKCGKEIANDSNFCEFCGEKIKKSVNNQRLRWIIPTCAAIVLVIAGVLLIILHKGETSAVGDRKDMNIKGPVVKLVETSYYTSVEDGMIDQQYEGGFFDGAAFLSVVYSDEHIGGFLYKKFFLAQVSDCEMEFDEFGNIVLLKSLWEEGGRLHFQYDKNHRVVEMDARETAANQSEGIVLYEYKVDKKLVVEETVTQKDEYGEEIITIKYQYDANKHLSRADMEYRGSNCLFTYNDNKLASIFIDDFYGGGRDLSIRIEYNTNGDIQKVTAGNGVYSRTTTFDYQYDSYNNWIERIGTSSFSVGEIKIKSNRILTYK